MPRTAQPRQPAPTPSPAAPRGCTSFKLRQLTRRVGRRYDRQVAASGLKTTQYSLLSHLAALGPVAPGALARDMEMDASTLTRNLQPLVAAGLVTVGAGADGRTRRVALTPAGRAKRVEAQREWKRAQLALNDALGADRVAALHAMLEECLALVEAAERG